MRDAGDGAPAAFDLKALEFPAVLDMVAARAMTPLGRRRARALRPSGDAREVARRGDCLREMLLVEAQGARLPFEAIELPDAALSRLALPGAALDAMELLNLARLGRTAEAIRSALGALADLAPQLAGWFENVGEMGPLVTAIACALSPDGRVEDAASPQIRSIRRRRAAATARLREQLSHQIDLSRGERILQDDYIAQRNDRFVIPVRADSAGARNGIVHGTSASGQTLFVEPLETVPLNNELVRLGEEERAAERRVLRSLTGLASEARGALTEAADVVADIDVLGAASRLARDLGGAPARSAGPAELILTGVRHPVLEAALRAASRRAVPIDVRLTGGDSVLTLSGPNTGGKTVALKTIGIAVLMNQSGLPVLARQAVLPVYGQVLADIGDHQSIEANLSTFSSHMRELARMTDHLRPPALVLVDELGTGTDPEEGTALGIAVVDFLRARGAMVIVTTHHNGLKAYAETTDGVVNAAVEFDTQRMAPTYRLVRGVAGQSSGIDVAERLGLRAEIVASARGLVSQQGQVTSRYIARLAELTGDLSREREALAQELENARVAAEAARRESRRRAEDHQRELRDVREAARARLETAIERAVRKLDRTVEQQALQRAASRARAEFSRRTGTGRPSTSSPAIDAAGPEPGELRPGERVMVRALGTEAIVEKLDSRGRVAVRVGRSLWTVGRADVTRLAPGRQKAVPGGAAVPEEEDTDEPQELRLIGKRVDEALQALERFIDRALMTPRRHLRIIHGHGTGRLRQAVRQALSSHPSVGEIRAGTPAEGGEGVTMARLDG
ncbi:MAG: endonuclease MutS2 [Acidobacteriota bacterium]